MVGIIVSLKKKFTCKIQHNIEPIVLNGQKYGFDRAFTTNVDSRENSCLAKLIQLPCSLYLTFNDNKFTINTILFKTC